MTQPTTCFACGTENPLGLHVAFVQDDGGGALAHYQIGEHLEGWPGITHGGVLATLLDEAMAYALWFAGHRAVTARMETRFRRPVGAGTEVDITAQVTLARRGIVDAEAKVMLPSGEVVAEAIGRFVPADVSY